MVRYIYIHILMKFIHWMWAMCICLIQFKIEIIKSNQSFNSAEKMCLHFFDSSHFWLITHHPLGNYSLFCWWRLVHKISIQNCHNYRQVSIGKIYVNSTNGYLCKHQQDMMTEKINPTITGYNRIFLKLFGIYMTFSKSPEQPVNNFQGS